MVQLEPEVARGDLGNGFDAGGGDGAEDEGEVVGAGGAGEAGGGVTVAAACLIDRSGGKAEVGVPLAALARLDIPTYEPGRLPPELAALPAVKPGSRGLK